MFILKQGPEIKCDFQIVHCFEIVFEICEMFEVKCNIENGSGIRILDKRVLSNERSFCAIAQ